MTKTTNYDSYMELHDFEDAFNSVRHTINGIFDVLLSQSESQLLEDFLVQGIPIIGLL
jgi:hypothetical protein